MVEADAANHSSEGANEDENKDYTVNLVQSFDGLAIDETPAMVQKYWKFQEKNRFSLKSTEK